MHAFKLILAVLATSWPAAVYAQYFPIAGVPGLRAMNIEIAGNMMRNSARQGSEDTKEFAEPPKRITNVAGSVAKLTYKSSTARRTQNLAKFVEKSRGSDPSGADQMSQLLASTDIIGAIGQGIAPFGLRVDNVADAYTVYWTNAWLGSRGRNDTLSKQQISAVRNQAANALLATNEFISATDAEKQEMAEAMLVQAALIEASVDNAKSNPATMTKVKTAIAQGAKAMGLDLYTMTLTPNGFVPAKKGSAVDENTRIVPSEQERQQALASANSSSESSNYALIAAAGGVGVGGMFLLGKAMGRKN
jgi:hypothetical protein